MKKIIVTGSLAYDNLMTFEGEFSQSLIAGELGNLSVSFLASGHAHGFGGCAGNIAYNLRLLDLEPVVLGVAGADFERYGKWLKQNGISTNNIFIDRVKNTAAAYVLSDSKQNQIAIFSPGAMDNYQDGMKLTAMNFSDVACAIIAPEPPKRMVHFGRYFKNIGVPFIFDPGQAIPALQRDEIIDLMRNSVGMIVNDYELEMVKQKIGMDMNENGFLVITTGEKGCELIEKKDKADGYEHMFVPAVRGVKVVDVTGCGDAFRAGFLSGYVNGLGLRESCERGNRVAAFALEKMGAQGHHFTLKDL